MSLRAFRGMTAALVLAASAVISVPSALAQNVTEEHGACFRQQHTLVGAITMYNLDYNENVTEIPWGKLHEDGYFPSSWTPGDGLQDPGAGAGSHTNYQLSGRAPSGLLCTRHGYPGHPNPLPAAPPVADARRCHDVQRTVSGAVSMYNSDYNTNVTEIPWEQLQREGYLHHVPEDPGQGPFSFRNYVIDSSSPFGLSCRVHGAPPLDQEFLRRCLATQRLISGAVEMYNLDFNENVARIPWDALVGGGYLVRRPRDPGGPDGSHVRFSLDPNSPTGIRCRRHGSAADWSGPGGSNSGLPTYQPSGNNTGGDDLFGLPKRGGAGAGTGG